MNKAKFLSILGASLMAYFATLPYAYASQSQYSVSAFAQFCAANPSTCNKTDFQDARTGSVSCPGSNQVISNIYVHAGNGQTVWELPDAQFSYSYSNNNSSVTVNALTGTKDISWIAVVCANPAPTATPAPTITPTILPTSTPTPTVTVTVTPIVTPTPTKPLLPTATPNIKVTPTSTPTVTVTVAVTPTTTPTPTDLPAGPTATPTPGSSNDNSSTSSTSTNNIGGGEVLGVSTLSYTSSNSGILESVVKVFGSVFVALGLRLRKSK